MNNLGPQGGEGQSQPEKELWPVLPEPKTDALSVDKEAITERILDKVIDAAERNEPIEQDYELRHEVKDKKAQPSVGYAPMESVGDILGQQTLQRQQQAINPNIYGQQEGLPTLQPSSSTAPTKQHAMTYKQAITYGFLAGLTLVGVIATLMFA